MAVVLLGGCLLVGTGCDEHVAGQLATLSGGYLGDVVSVVVTRCLETALGVEDAEPEGGDHTHEAESLHEHQH